MCSVLWGRADGVLLWYDLRVCLHEVIFGQDSRRTIETSPGGVFFTKVVLVGAINHNGICFGLISHYGVRLQGWSGRIYYVIVFT